MPRSARSATICDGEPRTCSRARAIESLPSADPHRIGCDDLDADPIAIDETTWSIDVLLRVGVEALEAQPRPEAVAERRLDPARVQVRLDDVDRLVGSPRD